MKRTLVIIGLLAVAIFSCVQMAAAKDLNQENRTIINCVNFPQNGFIVDEGTGTVYADNSTYLMSEWKIIRFGETEIIFIKPDDLQIMLPFLYIIGVLAAALLISGWILYDD